MRGFFQITKVDEEKRLVYGCMTSEALDVDNEICDYATTKPLIEAWSMQLSKASDGENLGNVRTMHNRQLQAVGKLVSLDCDDEAKTVSVCAYIGQDEAWKGVTDRIYTGFSQGGRYVKRWPDPVAKGAWRYTLKPLEISLVDLPANSEATFTLIKASGASERLGFKITARADVSASDRARASSEASAFADEKNKKYKLDTEAQVRAAWSYINMPKNQKEYSAADVATIKGKIIAAWKAKIDKAGPPSAMEKGAVGDCLTDVKASILAAKFATSHEPGLARWRLLLADYVSKTWQPVAQKGLFTVGWFANLLQQLSNLTADVALEEQLEQDGSPLPETLRALLKELAVALEDYTSEEVEELLATIGNDQPGVTPEGETKMAADDTPALKYSPDQERDDHGRVGSGGGSDSLAAKEKEADRLSRGHYDKSIHHGRAADATSSKKTSAAHNHASDAHYEAMNRYDSASRAYHAGREGDGDRMMGRASLAGGRANAESTALGMKPVKAAEANVTKISSEDNPGGTPAASTEGEDTMATKTAEQLAAEEATKAGARHSKADLAHLQAAHTCVKEAGAHLKALGATDGDDEAEGDEAEGGGGGEKKVAKLAGQVTDLTGQLAEAHEALKAATVEIKRLNGMIRPAAGAAADISHLRVATKAADADGAAEASNPEVAKAAEVKKYGGDPETDPKAAFKKAQDKPFLISPQSVVRRPAA